MKMKKRFIVSAVVVMVLLTGAIVFSASGADRIPPPPEPNGVDMSIPADEVEAFFAEQYRLMGVENPRVKRLQNGEAPLGPSQEPLYNLYYAKADEEQRKKLDEIMKDTSRGGIGTWTRDVLITMGELSADTPRLTLEYVEKYVEEEFDIETANTAVVLEAFNKIAGAPDWEGGSGMYRSVYFLDDERSEAILVMMGGIIHDVPEGQKASVIINGPEITAEPSPSSAPRN